MKLSISAYILVLFSAVVCVQSYKLLLFFPGVSTSHFILGTSLAKGLAKAGHNVTLVTPFEDKNVSRETYRQIAVTEIEQSFKKRNMNMFGQRSVLTFLSNFPSMLGDMAIPIHRNPEIQQLVKNKETFDAVIIETVQLDSLQIYPYLFKAAYVGFSPMGANSWVNYLVANPSPLSYIPEVVTGFPSRMTFFQRLGNVIASGGIWALKKYFLGPSQNEILKRYYPNAPDMDQLESNLSLVLLNSNVATLPPVPLVPNMIPIGGYHIQPPEPLPKDLKDFLDNATEGVVYFSMGSVINTNNIPQENLDVLLNTFKQLKQKVLWKFNEDLPGKSANVKIEKWLPQQSILAHPNVRLFITHCGFGSTTETIYRGKPVLAMPIFGDQPMNAKQMENYGIGLIQEYNEIVTNPQSFLNKIKELLNNPQYYENAQQRSKVFRDLPMTPMDTANFWIEYAIRHKGAPHLKVVGAELPWYKLYLVDVWAFLIVSGVLVFKIIKVLCKKIMCRGKQQNKLKQS